MSGRTLAAVSDPSPDAASYAEHLLRSLPGAVFVIDGVGTILHASAGAAALVEQEPDALVGTSVLDFVDAEAAWSYASAVAMATDFPNTYMGPMRVSLTSPSGINHTVDLWATNQFDDPAIGGIVCLITEETAAMGMSEAIDAIAGDQPLSEVAGLVARSMRGHPVRSDAVVIEAIEDRFRVMGDTPVPRPIVDLIEKWVDDDATEPWRAAIASGTRVLHGDLGRSPAALRDAASAAGYQALWIEPLWPEQGRSPAVLAVWRDRTGDPSPNSINTMHKAAGLLAVAFRLST
jgi:hypothetical protein